MAIQNSITGTITSTERLRSSYYGNPRFKVSVKLTNGDTITLHTQSDSSVNYDIENREHSGKLTKFTLSRAGRITGAETVAE